MSSTTFGMPLDELSRYPERIVCLTEETTETLYLLGEDHRIAGVSGYTARPPQARSKPRVSAFTSAKFDKIAALNPDLILAFSDLQADIVRELTRQGFNVVVFNQRSIREILEMILILSRIVGAQQKGQELVTRLQTELAAIAASAQRLPRRLRVLFEEWNDPLITGIEWVEELIQLAGGDPVFPEISGEGLAVKRIVSPQDVVPRDPEIVIASWCGKKVNKEVIRSRPGWSAISAVREGHIYEIKSTYILQPGPAALTEGVRQIHVIIARALGFDVDKDLAPQERLDAALAR